MAEFDPYHRWLSISPEDQPPNHYRLLGIKPLESDLDAIESAADRQMAHVRSFQSGKHADWSQKLLNELAAAKICLLAPAQKAAYDGELRAKLAASAPPAKSSAKVVKPLPIARPLAGPLPPPPAPEDRSMAPPGLDFDPLERPTVSKRSSRRQTSLFVPVAAIALVGLAAAGWAVWRVVEPRDEQSAVRPVARANAVAPGDNAEPSARASTLAADSGGASVHEKIIKIPRRDDNEPSDPASSNSDSMPSPQNDSSASASDENAHPSDANPASEIDDLPAATNPTLAATADRLPVDAPGRSAPPDAQRQQVLDRDIRELFADDYNRAKNREQKGTLARKLLKEAGKSDDPALRYGLWNAARELAVGAGDYELAWEAIAGLSAGYSLDGLPLKCSALAAAAPAARGAQRRALAGTALALADEALNSAHFSEAQSTAKVALTLARGTKDAAFAKAATTAVKQINDALPIYEKATQAIEALRADPDDAQANLLAGKFLCLVKWDWPRGLPLLVKGSNPELRELAQRELDVPGNVEAQADLADAWWDAARRGRGSEKTDMEQRSGQWYLRCVDPLSGARKQLADRRIKELADKPPAEAAAAGAGLIHVTNEFAAKRAHAPDVEPGQHENVKAKEVLAQIAPGFSVKWTGVEIFAEHFGRKNVLRTHPTAETQPGTLYGTVKVPARMHTRLVLSVSAMEGGDWDLIVSVNDQQIHKSTVNVQSGINGWREVSIDLTPYAGQPVELQLMNKNTGWFKEWGLWDRIAVITSR